MPDARPPRGQMYSGGRLVVLTEDPLAFLDGRPPPPWVTADHDFTTEAPEPADSAEAGDAGAAWEKISHETVREMVEALFGPIDLDTSPVALRSPGRRGTPCPACNGHRFAFPTELDEERARMCRPHGREAEAVFSRRFHRAAKGNRRGWEVLAEATARLMSPLLPDDLRERLGAPDQAAVEELLAFFEDHPEGLTALMADTPELRERVADAVGDAHVLDHLIEHDDDGASIYLRRIFGLLDGDALKQRIAATMARLPADPALMESAAAALERSADEPGAARLRHRVDRLALPKTGRNEPCPCGSGRKFKQCHLT